MLMASAYLPVFRMEKLGGKLYADGGVRDVLPIHVLIENGYRNIIALRLYGTGVERSVRIPRGTQVYTVAPSADLGGTMEYESERTRRNMRLGYYDAKRFLYGLRGEVYYIDSQWDEERARDFLSRAAMRVGAPLGWTLRGVHERLLPALAKALDREKGGYLDVVTAALERCAADQMLDICRICTEE